MCQVWNASIVNYYEYQIRVSWGVYWSFWASLKLAFQTKSKKMWSHDAYQLILLRLPKTVLKFRTSISPESPDLPQTNSMWQAILSNLLVPCWFQFHSLHHAKFMHQAFFTDYKKIFWFPRISNSWESLVLHQTNSMRQATLSDLHVHYWFQFPSLHHADSML